MNIIPSIFHWICDASLRASFLTVVILLLRSLPDSFISARCRYMMWLPLLLVLVLPVFPQSRWSVENMLAARRHAVTPVSPPAPAAAMAPEAAAIPHAASGTGVSTLDWEERAAIVWAAGVALILAGGFISYRSALRRFLLKTETPGDLLTKEIGSLCAGLHLRRSPRVILSPAVESPAVTGLLRPILLLPADFATAFEDKEARLVLKHELLHIKRLDLQINALACLLNALHWFNPLLWLAAWCARQDRETACDAQVLASEPRDCRNDYGHMMLKIQSTRATHGLSLGFVGIFERGRALRSRIKAIAQYRRPGPAGAVITGIAIALLGLLGATRAQDNPPATATSAIPAATPAAKTALPHHGKKDEYGAILRQKIQDKLDRIIIPKIDFHNVTILEAVEFLHQKSRELDAQESNPARRGVNIVLKLETVVPGDVSTTKAPVSPRNIGTVDARLSLSRTNVPLSEALASVANLAGFKVKIDLYAVTIVPFGEPTDLLITQEYKVPLGFLANAPSAINSNLPAQHLDAKTVLSKARVDFPPGASANYIPSNSRLIVRNTDANLDLVDKIVEALNSQAPLQTGTGTKPVETPSK